MQKSAKIMGREIGLTASEMKWLLKDQGFLEGRPGDYSFTEKALPFSPKTESVHLGPGGYLCYNHYYDKQTIDDSVMNALDTSKEALLKAKEGLRAYRSEQRESKLGEAINQAADEQNITEEDVKNSLCTIGKIAIPLAVLVAVGYGTYRWKRKMDEKKKIENDEISTNET